MSVERLMPSTVKYGSYCVRAIVRNDFAVLTSRPRLVPEPNTLSWRRPACSTSLSVDEKPMPRLIWPVGFSVTLTFTSTWSGAPGTSSVVMLVSVK